MPSSGALDLLPHHIVIFIWEVKYAFLRCYVILYIYVFTVFIWRRKKKKKRGETPRSCGSRIKYIN